MTPTTDTRRRPGGDVYVLGGGAVGHEVARRLTADGESVTVVSRTAPAEPPVGQTVHVVDALDAHSLRGVGLDEATAAFVLDADDATNLLVAQLARSRFDVARVLVLVNDPDRAAAFDRLAVETVDGSGALAHAVAGHW